MDAFYASIEIRDNPLLRGLPVVVGGLPGSRGVVAAASYEARRFGIHSAMPSSRALKICPKAVFLRPRFEAYQAVSSEIRRIFSRYTDLIEPLSLDEAFLDVTGHERYASVIAREIRGEIFKALQLTASAGVAPNKMVAKIATDIKKPNGQTVVPPDAVRDFMLDLPVKRIPGIGPVTAASLAKLHILTCRDALLRKQQLEDELGRLAPWLIERAQGIDERPVEPFRIRKSIGHEETFPSDVTDLSYLTRQLERMAGLVAQELAEKGKSARTVTLKVKYADFTLVTRSSTFPFAVTDVRPMAEAAKILLTKTEAGTRKIRLIGISLSKLADLGVAGSQETLLLGADGEANWVGGGRTLTDGR